MKKKCQVCDCYFYVKPSHFEKRFCCSKECQNKNQKIKQLGDKNHNYKGGIKETKCNHCNVLFKPKTYIKRKYCSTKCASESKRGLFQDMSKAINAKIEKGKNNPRKKCDCGNKKDIKAKQCKKCFLVRLKQKSNYIYCMNCASKTIKKYKNKKYCSMNCFSEHAKIKYLSENNPNWKGGVKTINQIGRYSKDYNTWVKKTLEKHLYTCQKCFCVGGELHAHHFYPWAKYKEYRYDLNNGITLCKPCHRNVHKTKDSKFLHT